ncbi:MAG: aminopeptidase N [Halioglobus sp.]
MRDASPSTIFLKDYQVPAFLIDTTDLAFELHETETIVTATLSMRRNPDGESADSLQLDGQDLELLAISIDGTELPASRYSVNDQGLILHALPEAFELTTRVRIHPQDNTSLEGLYKSRTMFCTQCEAEGFRKITYYLDRPDIMSVFTVSIDADTGRYPVLLSNGNPVSREDGKGGRAIAVWHDPFPKPAYLFALVAGELSRIEDQFTTSSGRVVDLHIYVEEKDIAKCGHAMQALQKSMRWDEEVYGREYDLDLFNIVAVDDFNMGAMENKSLNIFNTSCVLCSPQTTTDVGFQTVEAIVAHEYFHNWSGNRVTCRDWFQLSLKEGFTVFRDAEFSADMGSRTVKRIEDVTVLRTLQFAEDGGPMAHPIRPDSFIEISNFYTVTVYEKGAEVVRMIHTLLGPDAFRRGSDLYFERHDGCAVTCEDFVQAMEEASGVDLAQFRRWYSQAGTPTVSARGSYDESARTYTLTLSQDCPATPGQSEKQPFVIPVAMGLLGDAGNLRLNLADAAPNLEAGDNTQHVLMLTEPEQTFVFTDVPECPVPSLLRSFSAPVRLDYPYARNDLRALMSRDADGFVRWDAGQQLMVAVLGDLQTDPAAQVDPLLLQACADLLSDSSLDAAMVADMLRLPTENYLAELAAHKDGADVDAIHVARQTVRKAIGLAHAPLLLERYHELATDQEYAPDAQQIAARSLRNVCLDYLAAGGAEGITLAVAQFKEADNMTDRLAALRVIAWEGDDAQRASALQDFYSDWRSEALVVNQWFLVQACIPDAGGLERVRSLMSHEDFDLRNPNKVRSLIGGFASNNPVNFHRKDGSGYEFLADSVIELDTRNPQLASRLLAPLTKWRNYPNRAELMCKALERIAAQTDLSPDVFEVVTKALKN